MQKHIAKTPKANNLKPVTFTQKGIKLKTPPKQPPVEIENPYDVSGHIQKALEREKQRQKASKVSRNMEE
jgi:hypothetical protein